MAVPYTFGTATSSIPLSQLDSNFSTAITLGNTAIQLGNTATTLNNMTLANVTIASGNVTLTNVTVTTANVTTANITTAVIVNDNVTNLVATSANVTTANVTTANITNNNVSGSETLSGGTANGVAYLNGSKVVTTGSALTFDGTGNFFLTAASGGSEIRSYSSAASTTAALSMRNPDRYWQMSSQPGGAFLLYDTTGSQSTWSVTPGASGYSVWYQNGSEQMRLTSTGLGIGTSNTGGAKLYIAGGSLSSSPGVGGIAMSGNLTTGRLVTQGTGGLQAIHSFYDGSSLEISQGSTGAQSGIVINGPSATNNPSTLQFFTNGTTERMRLDSSGNLGIGTSSPNRKLEVGGTTSAYMGFNSTSNRRYTIGSEASGFVIYDDTAGAYRMVIDAVGNLLWGINAQTNTPANGIVTQNATGASQQLIGHANGSGSGTYYNAFFYNSSVIGSITQSGTTAVLFNVTSDQRLKENIVDAGSASSLVDALQVRQYDWKSDGSHQRYGFIAQELVTVAPEAVHQPADPEEMMAVDYSKLVPMLVKEIQDLRKRLAALEAK